MRRWLAALLLILGLVTAGMALDDPWWEMEWRAPQLDRIPYTNVAQNKDYFYLEAEPRENYPDFDLEKLTDGRFAWSWADMVGWLGESRIAVEIDLGKVHENVVGVSVISMVSLGSAVRLPEGVRIYGSVNGNDFTLLGDANSVARDSGDYLHHWYLLFDATSVRYIMVEVDGNPSGWTMIPEVMVWSK